MQELMNIRIHLTTCHLQLCNRCRLSGGRADHVCVSGDQLSTSKASLLFAPKQNGNALIVKYLIRSSLTKVCSKSIHPRRNSILTHSCHVGEMNNRTFVGDIQVSDLAPENSTFVQTQGATLYRHLYKHRRRHYNVTVTWRHYYIRLVFPRHDKWQETDEMTVTCTRHHQTSWWEPSSTPPPRRSHPGSLCKILGV